MTSARVGGEVEQLCGRCKELRYHTISAMGAGGRIEQVVCNFCHSSHRYHAPAGKAAGSAAPRKARAPRTTEPDERGPARNYAPRDTYEKGEAILHAKYGRGKVTDVRGDRIDVRFSDGSVRVFLHAVKAPESPR